MQHFFSHFIKEMNENDEDFLGSEANVRKKAFFSVIQNRMFDFF